MIILPLSCTCSDLKVFPKNWMSAKVSIKKDWYVYYRFYDPVFKENPTYKKGMSCPEIALQQTIQHDRKKA